MLPKLSKLGEETSMIELNCYQNTRCSLVASMARHLNGSLKMHWSIQDGLLIVCEMKQQRHQPSARTNMPLKSMPSSSLSVEK